MSHKLKGGKVVSIFPPFAFWSFCLSSQFLYYKCRKDNQIKYKGYRIELLDIEENLYNLNYFDKVQVIEKRNEENKIIKLIGFVKLKSNINKNVLEIKKDLFPRYSSAQFIGSF